MNSAWILDSPRLHLGHLPTPLVLLERLTAQLRGPRIWLKRDDCTGLATGGNKTRKLEYLLAEARKSDADLVVTFGAVQSNHARQTAAACAALGLPCHLVLSRRVRWQHPGYESSGNVLLDRLLGAEIHLTDRDQVADTTRALLTDLRAAGHRPYVIPAGGSNATGALGYARCALELAQQSTALGLTLTQVMHASSSAGTQAGLVAGFAGLFQDRQGPDQRPVPLVHGINVYEPDPETLAANVLRLANQVLDEKVPGARVTDGDIHVDHRYFGQDYGIPTAETLEAIRLLARTEGVLLDPVYSGKGFSGLIDRVRLGEFDGTEDLVFIHTGGTASLGVYETAFDAPRNGNL